jgi:hypothetical protein
MSWVMRERQWSRRHRTALLRRTSAAFLLAMLGLSAPAAAQVNAEPALAAARDLWRDGTALYEAGDYLAAADRFDRAYELEHAPSLGIWVARAWTRGGSLLAALARYRELAEQALAPDVPQRDWAAKRDAQLEQRALVKRIPTLVIEVNGSSDDRLSVTINGEPLSRSELGTPRMVDPGRLKISALDGPLVGEAELDVKEGETRRVQLRLAARTAPGGAMLAPRSDKLPPPPPGNGKGTHLVSYVFMGVGGASLLTGVVFGFMALHDEARLKTLCTGTHCPPSLASDIDTYRAEKTIATVGMLSGAALALAGATIYVLTPSPAHSGSLGLTVTGRSVGLVGHF